MARLRNEELEEELVRYKLLYSPNSFPCVMVLTCATDMPKSCMRTQTPCRLIACHHWVTNGEVTHDPKLASREIGNTGERDARVIHVMFRLCGEMANGTTWNVIPVQVGSIHKY